MHKMGAASLVDLVRWPTWRACGCARAAPPRLIRRGCRAGEAMGAMSWLAYTVPYAIGNILLTIWGPVVVAVVHMMRS